MPGIKYALIGCGRIAPNHIVAAEKNGLDIVAVCDIIRERAETILSYLPSGTAKRVKIYTDYNLMLSECSLQLVAVAAESGKHYQIGMDCIAAACNIIIEKPIALDIEHADRLIAAAREKNVKLCACHQNRFNKAIRKIRDAVDNNMFGKLFHGTAHIRWNRGKEYYGQAAWRGTWAQDGGALMNQCIHNIDLLRWLMGDEIAEVFAYTDKLNHEYIEAEDLGIALIKFKNGAYGIIEGTTNAFPHNLEETLYLFGERGTVKAGGKSVNSLEEWRFADSAEKPEDIKALYSENPPNIYGFGHIPLYADMLNAIESGRAPYVDGDAGKRALELVLAIYKSAKTGRKVDLPLKSGSTLEFRK